ncbi:MAG TPA: HAMP domain-containing sensor histidine kinase [Solirubrobacteraceae bacterium]
MRRPLSLHVWLGFALALAMAVPALAGLAAWGATGRWQEGREAHRRDQALGVLRTAQLDSRAHRDAVLRGLAALRVEAQLGPAGAPTKIADVDRKVADAAKQVAGATKPEVTDAMAAKLALAGKPELLTAAFTQGDPKPRLDRYRQVPVATATVGGLLWVPRESPATRWAVALGAGLAALGAALVVIVVLLRRWVLQPLARLAADAERIAGGELDVEPLPTRAREVAQVGDALHGMARGLSAALRTSTAAEHERRFMVTAIAHDLRTPLFTLRGSLEALERGVGDARYLDRAQAKAAHLDRLVGDLFTFSRLEYARESIAFEEVDVGALARRAAEDAEPIAAARGCVLQVSRMESGLAVRGDADALLRVLTNLLDNAIRHGRGRVILGAQRENGAVRLEIVDDGPGFAPDDLDHVFEPLFRSDRARGPATGGTGLGLAIARRLARAHGGDIEAANDPAGGARATLTLPAALP